VKLLKFKRVTLETCSEATGTVVVIDVLRAFTCTAFAFAAGAKEIILVQETAEAFALQRRMPGVLLMGEVDGWPIEGFDYGNSPSALMNLDLTGYRLVQRTSRGTLGVVRSTQADMILTSSFCCAKATADYILDRAPDTVTFVITGLGENGMGDEDVACADYLEALLQGHQPAPEPFLTRVRESVIGQALLNPSYPELPAEDLPCCTDLDRFDFAMRVRRRNGLLVMKPAQQKI
jgi:2-phosphosulfolactate phosphatase